MSTREKAAVSRLRPITDDLLAFLECLPPSIQSGIYQQRDVSSLLEVVLDLGRLPLARFAEREVYLGSDEVTDEDIQQVLAMLSPFGDDNRAGIERTLHRISAMRNRAGKIVGLTCRVGRAIMGTVRVVEDLVNSGKSILLVGRPGVGKTTMLREMARVLADTVHKRVVIVDTSNEIAGDGDIPHPAIGAARRMQVVTPALQHAVMIEAVENHMPEVIIVDEMGTEQEAVAARTIAERGVQLIATAHGNTLENLLINPTLSDLVGGIQTVTLSDEEARRRRTQKTILERKAPPTFQVLVEIQSWERVAVHVDVALTVDRLLRGAQVVPETRWLDEAGALHRSSWTRDVPFADGAAARQPAPPVSIPSRRSDPGPVARMPGSLTRVHTFGVNRERLREIALAAGLPFQVVDTLSDADIVLTTKSHFRKRSGLLRNAEEQEKPVFVLRRNTSAQLLSFLHQVAGDGHQVVGDGSPLPDDAVARGTEEAQAGVERVLGGRDQSVQLSPQGGSVRRIQHQIAERARLESRSTGREPRRRVSISRG